MGFFDDLFKGVTSTLTGNPFGIISSIGNTIGSFIGASNQNSTQKAIADARNELDYQMWQEEKEHNIEMFNLENQANVDMWNMENQANLDMWRLNNAYNDPSAQAQRLLKAGINPYLYMSGQSGSAGNSGSAPSVGTLNAGSIPASNRPTPQGYDYTDPYLVAGAKMLESYNVLTQGTLTNLMSRGQKIANDDAENEFMHNKKLRKNAALRDDKFTQVYGEQIDTELAIQKAAKTGADLDNETKRILNSWLPIEKQMEYFEAGQRLVNMALEAGKTINQIYYDTVDFYYGILQSEKDLEVKDSQIEANKASASASNSVVSVNYETARGLKMTNDANSKWNVASSIAKSQMAQNESLFKQYGLDNDFYTWLQNFTPDGKINHYRNRYNHRTGHDTSVGFRIGPLGFDISNGYTSQPGY